MNSILSGILIGSTLTILGLDIKSEAELDQMQNDPQAFSNTYEYLSDIVTLKRQLEDEKTIIELADKGSYDNPFEPDERLLLQFSHIPKNQYKNFYQVHAIIELQELSIVDPARTVRILKDVNTDDVPEGYEWTIFNIQLFISQSTDPNVGYLVSQRDFRILLENGEYAPNRYLLYDQMMEDVDVYERGMANGYVAKLIPKDKPFYIKYQYQDSDEYMIVYVEDKKSLFERGDDIDS